ncbi:MAG: penicillin-binding protein 2 [Gammaproteobacteria bacterium]|nr:MAG: penicillin-binding protein 2 [Gammaproteobacteria bacterium]
MAKRVPLKDAALESRIYRNRVILAALLIALLLLVIISRFFTLQVLQHDVYRTYSERNRVHVQPVPPKRGLIYDRHGRLLAENIPSYALTLTKERVENLEGTLSLLQELLSLNDEEIERFYTRMNQHRPFEAVPVRFKLSDEEIATVAINRYRLPGVEVEAQLVRHYPMGELFAHALGYMGRINERELASLDAREYAGTHHIGKLGIEYQYENVLHGSVGYENVETNARGRVLRVLDSTPPVPGEDLHLHLDAYVQQVAFDALQGERGAVVAIDPATGGVVAFVSTPSYDPNLFIRGISHADYNALRDSEDRPLFNRALQGQYPPGSTVKPIFALAGLEYGVMTPTTMVPDPGWYQLPNDERKYRDWKFGGHGALVGLFQAVVESCDVYFYELANRLGIDRLHSFTSHFGFGDRTGIDLPNEATGLMPSREWKRKQYRQAWYPGETLNVGIGQGQMLATPLQLADAAAMLANHGKRMQPQLVARVGDTLVEPNWVDGVSLRNPDYWQVVNAAMEGVVHSLRGTAKGISKDLTYRIAGKTGTAQVVKVQRTEQGHSIAEEEKRRRDHALFIAYAPADNPRLAVGIIVENGEHGSSAAAPIARKVFDAYFQGEPLQTVKPVEVQP